MLDRIRRFFQSKVDRGKEADPAAETAEQVELRLAASALFLEVAYADDTFSDDERRQLEGAIRRQFGLGSDQADELIRTAERERAGAVDLWRFTRPIRANYSLGQKMVLVEIMWGLAFADGTLSEREDLLMRRISNLLDLKVAYLSEARKRAVERGRP